MNVKLVWVTPEADKLVAHMARVSAPQNQGNEATAPKLIAYLIRNAHWSPFEMVNLCLEIDTTRDIARQLLRHRSFTFQEFSQRYANVNELEPVDPREARMQHPTNRQASAVCDDLDLAHDWRERQKIVREKAVSAYEWALRQGIAKEVARAVLPEGLTTTRLYMNGTLRSWLHFCSLRRGNGTQEETREIADSAWAIMRETCPAICMAWEFKNRLVAPAG